MENFLIVVAGGSASGKTTVVSKMLNSLNTGDVSLISMDNYYKDQSNLSMEERLNTNYDHPDSFDLDLLYEQLKELLEGNSIKEPVYDFKIHSRNQNETITVNPKKVIILEGILPLYDKKIRELASLKIYVESDPDIRFIRRLKRDTAERGRSIDYVINQYLDTVKPMYEKFIRPTKRYADIIIPNDKKHDIALKVILARIKEIIEGKW